MSVSNDNVGNTKSSNSASNNWLNKQNTQNTFAHRMLTKMGWSEGEGLGRSRQGISDNITAVKRQGESLGIGASIDVHGGEGYAKTRDGFVNVLEQLKQTHRTKTDAKDEKKKRSKKKKSSSADNGKSRKAGDTEKSKKSKKSKSSKITLAQNKVTAGHAAKWRAAKDLSTKSAADMAAIFGTHDVSEMLTSSMKQKKKSKKSKVVEESVECIPVQA